MQDLITKLSANLDLEDLSRIPFVDWQMVGKSITQRLEWKKLREDRLFGVVKPDGRIVSFRKGNTKIYRNHFDWFSSDGAMIVQEKVASMYANDQYVSGISFESEDMIAAGNGERFCDTLELVEFPAYQWNRSYPVEWKRLNATEPLGVAVKVKIHFGQWSPCHVSGISKREIETALSLPESPIASWTKLPPEMLSQISDHNAKYESWRKEQDDREEKEEEQWEKAERERKEQIEQARKMMKLGAIQHSRISNKTPAFFKMSQTAIKLNQLNKANKI